MKNKRHELSIVEQNEFWENPNVRAVSARMVQYTADFKRKVLLARVQGRTPRDLFVEAGIPIHYLPKKHIEYQVRSWTKTERRYGAEHMDIERRGRDGVALNAWRDKEKRYQALSETEKVPYLEAQVEALEYIRRHFQLPPAIHWKSPSSRRRRNTKS